MVCFLPLAAGCSEGSSLRIWTSRQGGVVRDFHQPRVDRVAAAIAQSEVGHPLAVQVLDSADPAAFSWPSGEVFVTRRLVDLLDDDELGAAIAHEMGQIEGSGAIVQELRRTLSGEFSIENSHTLAELEQLAQEGRFTEAMLRGEKLLPNFPIEIVDELTESQIRQGRDFRTSPFRISQASRLVKALNREGELIAIGEQKLPNLYHPILVL